MTTPCPSFAFGKSRRFHFRNHTSGISFRLREHCALLRVAELLSGAFAPYSRLRAMIAATGAAPRFSASMQSAMQELAAAQLAPMIPEIIRPATSHASVGAQAVTA